jgi:hypothetical protein
MLFWARVRPDAGNIKRARKLHSSTRQEGLPMNIASLSQPAQLLGAQQAGAVAAVSDNFFKEAGPQTSAAWSSGSSSTAATGSSASVLSNQTLQALLELTQSDPADQQSGTQGAHRRHHHHGASTASSTASTANDPQAGIAELDSGTSDDSESLATALGA